MLVHGHGDEQRPPVLGEDRQMPGFSLADQFARALAQVADGKGLHRKGSDFVPHFDSTLTIAIPRLFLLRPAACHSAGSSGCRSRPAGSGRRCRSPGYMIGRRRPPRRAAERICGPSPSRWRLGHRGLRVRRRQLDRDNSFVLEAGAHDGKPCANFWPRADPLARVCSCFCVENVGYPNHPSYNQPPSPIN